MASVSPYKIDEELQYGKIPSNTPFGKISGNQKQKEAILLTKFDEQLEAYKREIAPYHEIWDLCDKAFTGYKTALNTKDAKNRYRTNLRVWYAYKQVESQKSKILPAFFNFKPPYTVFPNDESSEMREVKARAAQKEMDYDFFQRQNAFDLLNRWVQQSEVRGFSPLKMFWDYEEGPKRIRRPIIDEETGEVKGLFKEVVEDNYILKDQPGFAVVDAFNFYWNPDAVCPDDVRVTYEEYYVPTEELKKSPLYFNTDDLAYDPRSNENNQNYRTGQTKNGLMINAGEEMTLVCERWDSDSLIVKAGNRITRYRDNVHDDGVIPYYYARGTVKHDELVGVGSVEPTLDLEKLANTILNMRVDNVSRIINRMIFVGATAGINTSTFHFRPGGIEKALDVKQILPMDMPDVTSSSYLEHDRAKREMDDVNGDPAMGRGESSMGKSTATETSALIEGASFRLQNKINYGFSEMGRMFRDMYRMKRQFDDPSKKIAIFGANGNRYDFTYEDVFIDDYEFQHSFGNLMGNQLIDMNQFIQWTLAVENMGLVDEYDKTELAKMAAQKANFHGVERLLKKPLLTQEGYYRDPNDENRKMIYYRQAVEVLPGERHNDHIGIHMKLLDTPGLPDDIYALLREHINRHLAFLYEDSRVTGAIGGMISQMQAANQPMMGQQQAAGNLAMGPAGVTLGGANVIQR